MLNSQLINGVMIDWDKIDRDSYQVTSMFINNREQILYRLLSEGEK